MIHLGGDIVRKIAFFLQHADADKEVVYLALTCKTMHHFLGSDLQKMSRIYGLDDCINWSRLQRVKRMVQKKRITHATQSISNILPPGKSFLG
jgi:hypothetical protein